jgi:transposase
MRRIVLRLTPAVKRRLRQTVQRTKDARLRLRCNIVLLWAEGQSSDQIAAVLQCAKSTALNVAHRFRAEGEAGLSDRRRDNGQPKVDPDLRQALAELLQRPPTHYGWQRPTWTRELLAQQLAESTGVQVSVTTVHRMLHGLGARWGEPRPVVQCPWSKTAKTRRLRELERLRAQLPQGEVLVYQDEAEVHLNPKLGRDWMLPGQQRQVLTPGQNQKRHVAGSLDARTGQVVWVWGLHRNSALFVDLLRALLAAYPQAKRIHLILDNGSLHDSRATQDALSQPEFRRVQLHFLPPYCPLENRIERLWGDLHDNVTRNHTCRTIETLVARVDHFLTTASPWPGSHPSTARGPLPEAA